jgi:methanogenic corrinoid protein MtbC1
MTEHLADSVFSNDDTAQRRHLVQLVTKLDEKEVLRTIEGMLASGWEPIQVMESCVLAMRAVGKRFENGQYFISALIMAGEIMRRVTELLEPHLPRQASGRSLGRILLGTILGDIHDLGKNLFALLARCQGYEVVDLGVDVAPQRFLSMARKVGPDIIGVSCVLSSTMLDLKDAVTLLHRELPTGRAKVMIGGSYIDEHVFRHVGADHWAFDAAHGVQECKKIMGKTQPYCGISRNH